MAAFQIPTYAALTVPCQHRLGRPCPGCPYCGTVDMLSVHERASHGYGISLESSVDRVDDRAFRVEFRGWPQ